MLLTKRAYSAKGLKKEEQSYYYSSDNKDHDDDGDKARKDGGFNINFLASERQTMTTAMYVCTL